MPRGQLTEEQKTAMNVAKREAEERIRQGREAQSYHFGKYKVFCFDELNLCVQEGDDENKRSFYPSLDYCFRHVLHKEIGDRMKDKATDLLTVIQSAEKSVMDIAQKIAAQRQS